MRYADLGPDYYQRRAQNRRTIDYHVRELEALGLEVTLCRIPEPEPGQAATTPAACPLTTITSGPVSRLRRRCRAPG